MEVILLENIKKLGFKGDVVNVAWGYGLNFLIPQGKAKIATPSERRKAERLQEERRIRREEIKENYKGVAEKLHNFTLVLKKSVSSNDRLFGGVSKGDVVSGLKEQIGVEISTADIDMDSHIKKLGDYKFTVSLYEGEVVEVNLSVIQS